MQSNASERPDGVQCDDATRDAFYSVRARMGEALDGDNPGEFNRLMAAGDYDAAYERWMSRDKAKWRAAMTEFGELLDRMRWFVSGVEVPAEVEQAIMASPRRTWKSMLAGAESAIRALAQAHPRLDRILDNAAARRDEGQVFAEAARERRDRLYRERVEWVTRTYLEVRGKYAMGVAGDKAARMEVAVKYSRINGKKPMCDRTVCNILAAASGVDAAAQVETAE
jgi:hypothetical protein